MPLTPRERAVALVAGGIAAYAASMRSGRPPGGASLVDFVMGGLPEGARAEVDAALIDEVFACVAGRGAGGQAPAARGS